MASPSPRHDPNDPSYYSTAPINRTKISLDDPKIPVALHTIKNPPPPNRLPPQSCTVTQINSLDIMTDWLQEYADTRPDAAVWSEAEIREWYARRLMTVNVGQDSQRILREVTNDLSAGQTPGPSSVDLDAMNAIIENLAENEGYRLSVRALFKNQSPVKISNGRRPPRYLPDECQEDQVTESAKEKRAKIREQMAVRGELKPFIEIKPAFDRFAKSALKPTPTSEAQTTIETNNSTDVRPGAKIAHQDNGNSNNLPKVTSNSLAEGQLIGVSTNLSGIDYQPQMFSNRPKLSQLATNFPFIPKPDPTFKWADEYSEDDTENFGYFEINALAEEVKGDSYKPRKRKRGRRGRGAKKSGTEPSQTMIAQSSSQSVSKSISLDKECFDATQKPTFTRDQAYDKLKETKKLVPVENVAPTLAKTVGASLKNKSPMRSIRASAVQNKVAEIAQTEASLKNTPIKNAISPLAAQTKRCDFKAPTKTPTLAEPALVKASQVTDKQADEAQHYLELTRNILKMRMFNEDATSREIKTVPFMLAEIAASTFDPNRTSDCDCAACVNNAQTPLWEAFQDEPTHCSLIPAPVPTSVPEPTPALKSTPVPVADPNVSTAPQEAQVQIRDRPIPYQKVQVPYNPRANSKQDQQDEALERGLGGSKKRGKEMYKRNKRRK